MGVGTVRGVFYLVETARLEHPTWKVVKLDTEFEASFQVCMES